MLAWVLASLLALSFACFTHCLVGILRAVVREIKKERLSNSIGGGNGVSLSRDVPVYRNPKLRALDPKEVSEEAMTCHCLEICRFRDSMNKACVLPLSGGPRPACRARAARTRRWGTLLPRDTRDRLETMQGGMPKP